MATTPKTCTLVLGLSAAHADGCSVGEPVIGQLRDDWQFSPALDLIDAPACVEALTGHLDRADSVLIVAAVESALPSGRITEFDGAELGRLFEALTAVNQTDLVLALAIASWQNRLPDNLSMIALQYPRSGSAPTAEQIDELLFAAVRRLESWGHAAWRFAPIGVRRRA